VTRDDCRDRGLDCVCIDDVSRNRHMACTQSRSGERQSVWIPVDHRDDVTASNEILGDGRSDARRPSGDHDNPGAAHLGRRGFVLGRIRRPAERLIAAIDSDRRADGVAGCIGSKMDDEGGDFFRIGHPAQGNTSPHAREIDFLVRFQRAHDVGGDISGQHGIDANTMPGPFT
jgi:hypothetical protein